VDLGRRPGGAARPVLALMALLLAMAANVGVSTMVSSFRQTFTGFLDQRLAPELYVGVAPPRRPTASSPPPPANAASPHRRGGPHPPRAFRAEVQIMRPDPTYPENWRSSAPPPLPWGRAPCGAGGPRQRAARPPRGLAVGDPLDVTTALTPPGPRHLGDYGNPWAGDPDRVPLPRDLPRGRPP
jgi:putative ABC transport system permease protein